MQIRKGHIVTVISQTVQTICKKIQNLVVNYNGNNMVYMVIALTKESIVEKTCSSENLP